MKGDIVIDIDSCLDTINEAGDPIFSDDNKVENTFSFTVCGVPMSIDELAKSESSLTPSTDAKDVGGNLEMNGNKKEKRFSMSAKKPPKPPRPPRGLSLDAADQKLIREISELAMIKRARIERMKALKKMKASKRSYSSTSSSGNLIAMLFTVLFCIVIIFQGCQPWGIMPRNSSATGIISSPTPNGANEGYVGVVDQWTSPTSSVHASSNDGSSSLMQLVRGSDHTDDTKNLSID